MNDVVMGCAIWFGFLELCVTLPIFFHYYLP